MNIRLFESLMDSIHSHAITIEGIDDISPHLSQLTPQVNLTEALKT